MKYLFEQYDRRNKSIEVCVHKFKRQYIGVPCVSAKQVYNWITYGKIHITRNDICNKKRNGKNKRSAMMEHFLWNLEN